MLTLRDTLGAAIFKKAAVVFVTMRVATCTSMSKVGPFMMRDGVMQAITGMRLPSCKAVMGLRHTSGGRDAIVHGKWFLDLDVFHKGYARARDMEGWMHIDAEGLPKYSRRFAAVEPFYNGQARVECFGGAFEVIDETGGTVTVLRPPIRSEFAALSGDMVGFWRTQTIATAVRLGVFEALPSTEGGVASRCNLHNDGASRLLWALGELGLVRKSEGGWDVTPRGCFLRKDHDLTLADAALEYAGPFTRD